MKIDDTSGIAETILAVGDCNTLGVGNLLGASYPERVAYALGKPVDNFGYTMATSREGLSLLRDNLSVQHSCVIIQFGLVDSYSTFKYAPYVLYYPDNLFRKQCRSIVKKIKKVCRNSGLNRTLGEVSVVPEEEYYANMLAMVHMCGPRTVLLPETIPHHDKQRNAAIQRYNQLLARIAATCANCHLIDLYAAFDAHLATYYTDKTHANAEGYAYIAEHITGILLKNDVCPALPTQ